ncbi:uncharacterized protein LACBIDRAFT_294359 [Laccaria bicolor S238N-H82]|uniref:Predicted protein n=1 Tax=Laccaria bicolor (strain S238N-H82 / ATCC MYA-4686) TaxID=486041 RepID=B0DBN3_LACBS|nr:uncharacterized protein LACBIDRAFT_294359 [Laccaria bicolor S238N-H82]EDR08029.1 predicted protein [Laccaria bicolor S238N-H82]|eukprot:XP_001881099.1 predicted protein [Laccaria bicolor S238N-H82]
MYRLQLKASRDVRQGVFSREESGDGEDGAVEQHLPQFEVNPVPEKKPFKRAEGQNVGEREETRLAYVQQNDPWGEYKHSEDCGDGPRRRFLVWAEVQSGSWSIYKLKFSFPSRGDPYRLDAPFARFFIIEAKKGLVRLVAFFAILLDNLEANSTGFCPSVVRKTSGSISAFRRITVASVLLLVILKLSVLRLLEAYILWLLLNIPSTVPGMSSTSFDSPRIPPTSARFEMRRSSLTGPATYEHAAALLLQAHQDDLTIAMYPLALPTIQTSTGPTTIGLTTLRAVTTVVLRAQIDILLTVLQSLKFGTVQRPGLRERLQPRHLPRPLLQGIGRVLTHSMLQRLKFAFQPALSRQMTDTLTASPLMDHLVALQSIFLAVIVTGPGRLNETYIHLRTLIMILIDLVDEVGLLIGLLALPTTADDEILHLPVTLGLTIITNLPMVDLRRQDIDRAHRMRVVEAFHRDLEVIVDAKEPETGPIPAVKHGGQDIPTNLHVSAAPPNVSEANTFLNGDNQSSLDSNLKPLTSAQTTASATQDNVQADSTVIALNGDPGAKHPASSASTLPPVNLVNGDHDRSTPPGFVQRQMSRPALKHNILPSPTPSATPMSISSSATPAPTPFVHAPLLSAEEILKPETISSTSKAVQLNGTASAAMLPSSPSTALLSSTPANALGDASDGKLLSTADKLEAMLSYLSKGIICRDQSAPPERADAIMTLAHSPTTTKIDLAAKSDTNSLPTELPTFADAKSTAEALRVVVMTRLLCDRQRREDRVDPILLQNQLISPEFCVRADATSPEALVEEVYSGEWRERRRQAFLAAKPSLEEHLRKRHELVADKIQQLKEDYTSMHEKWKAHCVALNEQSRSSLASEIETIQHSGRTTRRSTAITDAVRSDLEMEQIIASLGNDDATDPNHLSVRNLATIPDMVSVTHGQVDYVFDDTNHAVENPKEYYGPHTGIHDWTDEEKTIFIDKFAAFPKQFGIIADYLPNKTSAQCVDYYYLHKKRQIDFRKIVSQFAPNKRRRGGTRKKKGNGLLADIAQHDAEVHQRDAAIPARATRGRKAAQPESRKSVNARKAAVQFEDTPTSTPTPEPEATRGRRRKSGPNPAPSTPATPTPFSAQYVHSLNFFFLNGSKPNFCVPQEEEPRPIKKAKRPRKTVKSAAIINDEPEGPSTDLAFSQEISPETFLTLLAQYGDDFKRIAASMPNKVYPTHSRPLTSIQVRNYYKFNGPALNFEKVAAQAPKRSPTPESRDGWKEPFTSTARPALVSPVVDTAPPMASLTQDSPAVTTALPSTSTLSSNSSQPQDAARHSAEATSKPSLTWMNGIGSRHMTHPMAPARPVDTPGMSPNHTRHYPTATYDPPPLNARPGSVAYPTPNVYSSYTQHSLPYHKYYSMPPRPPIPTSAPMHHSLLDVRAAGAASPTANRAENPYSAYSVPPAATTSEVAALRRPYYYPP